ncbi:MAG TPA: hypothetical protein VH079_00730 [Terriglobales bacterium]|nr:hypothetical protein [Terriglobales bacterium]
MKVFTTFLGMGLACLLIHQPALAQIEETSVAVNQAIPTAVVPRLIRVNGSMPEDVQKQSDVSINFALYKEQNSSDPLWQETQNVRADATGHYSVLLGATQQEGLPLDVFTSGEAHWLGIQVEGQTEQPRVLLPSVAYALKASDADTLGGKPASAYALAGNQLPFVAISPSQNSVAGNQPLSTPPLPAPQVNCTTITSDGTATVNQIAKFTTNCNLENSAIFENAGKVGIGNKAPAGTLDVTGTAFIRGLLTPEAGIEILPTGTATAKQGFSSNPVDIYASVFNPSLGAGNYLYRWQAEPSQNDLPAAAATLNLLFGIPGDALETGLSINRNGILSFAPGQTFPGLGSVTSVATGAGLTGGPITSNGTISIPAAGVTNAMLANPSITVKAGTGLSGGGTVALGGTVTLATTAGGTITGVTAGSGLTGGGTTGAVSLSLLKTCATGQVLAWSGTAWACSTISSGGLSGAGTTDGIVYFSNAANLASTAAPKNGQILIGSTGKVPVLATLTAGANVTITNAAGKITIASTGGVGGGATALPFFVTASGRTGSTIGAGTNLNMLWGFLLPYNVTSTEITYDVTTADNTAHLYDIGLFDNSGNLAVDLGPTAGTAFAAKIGFKTLAWKQGSTSLAAGRYYLGFTTNCTATCAKIAGATTVVSYAINKSAGASSGGALSTSITPPADIWNTGIQPAVVIQ